MTIYEAAQETGGDAAYQDFIDQKLKSEYGVNSIDDLSDEDKQDFFNSVEGEWKSDEESKNEAVQELRRYILEHASVLEDYVPFELEDEDPTDAEEKMDKIDSAMANPSDYRFRGKKGKSNITIVPRSSIYAMTLPFENKI